MLTQLVGEYGLTLAVEFALAEIWGFKSLLSGKRSRTASVVTQEIDLHPQVGILAGQPSSDTSLKTDCKKLK